MSFEIHVACSKGIEAGVPRPVEYVNYNTSVLPGFPIGIRTAGSQSSRTFILNEEHFTFERADSGVIPPLSK